MRKFTLLLGTAIAAASMAAAPVVKTVPSVEALKTVSNRHSQTKPADRVQRVRMTEDARKSAEGLRRAKKAAATVPGPAADSELITEAQGTTTLLSKSGVYYINSAYGMQYGRSDGNVLESVKSEDGKKLYLKYTISAIDENYIVGDIEGDKVTFNFPQYILHDEFDIGDGDVITFDDYALLCEFDEKKQWYFPSANQTYVMTIAEDGSLSVAEEMQDVLIGDCMWIDGEYLFDGEEPFWEWLGNGDTYESANASTQHPVAVPDGVTFEDWTLVNDIMGQSVKVGFAENGDIYIKGLYKGIPDASIVATAGADGKYTLANNQYLGIDESVASFIYFQTVSVLADGQQFSADLKDGGTVSYDKETSRIQFNCDIAFSSVTDRVYCFSYALKPMLVKTTPGATISRLITPKLIETVDFTDADNPAYVGFYLSNMDAEYNMLDLDKTFYQVILNDEPFEFKPEEYLCLKESMTDVPFLFNDTDNNDFEGYENGVHWVQFYFMFNTVENLGVRAGYSGADNKPIYSEVRWVEKNISVEGIADDTVESVRYFDLQGRAIASPGNGICIKSVTKVDGSVKTLKIIR